MSFSDRIEQVARCVEAGLGREQELHQRLYLCDPDTAEWKKTLDALSVASRRTSRDWRKHFFARLGRRGLTVTRLERLRHLGGLIGDLRLRVHPRALRTLIEEENHRRCDPPLSVSVIKSLMQGVGFSDLDWPLRSQEEQRFEIPAKGVTRDGDEFFRLALERRLAT